MENRHLPPKRADEIYYGVDAWSSGRQFGIIVSERGRRLRCKGNQDLVVLMTPRSLAEV